MNEVYLWGWHVFEAVINNKSRKIKKIYITKQHVQKLIDLNLNYIVVSNDEMIQNFGKDTQGIVFLTEQIKMHSLKSWLNLKKTEQELIVAIDCIQDPRNLGAIMRSALAFNVSAMLITSTKCASFNGSLAKASAGALEQIPIIQVVNLSNAMEELKKNGYFVYALDQNGKETWKVAQKSVLILGQEGAGLRELTKKKCDDIIKINTQKEFGVLNVSVAAGIAFYKILGN